MLFFLMRNSLFLFMSAEKILITVICVKNPRIDLSGESRISPGGGVPTPRGAPTYDFAKFSQKLHEIERIWAP